MSCSIVFCSIINVVEEDCDSNSPYSPFQDRKFTHFVPRSKFLQSEYYDLPKSGHRGQTSQDYGKDFQNISSYKRSRGSLHDPVTEDKGNFPSRIVWYQRESSSSQGGNNLDQYGFNQPEDKYVDMSSRSQMEPVQVASRSKETNELTLSSPMKKHINMDDQFNPISLVSALEHPGSARVFSPMAPTQSNPSGRNLPENFLIRQSEENQGGSSPSCRTQNFQEEEAYEYQESDQEQQMYHGYDRLQAREITKETIENMSGDQSYPSSKIALAMFSQNFKADPNSSLSRPAIISLSSNQKIGTRQNLTYTPSGQISNSSQQFQVNQNEYSGEMEGLDLTDEAIDAAYEDPPQQSQIMLQQPQMNHLSTIHDSAEQTLVSSQTKNFLMQQRDLDQVEAHLESEVQQLNMIYKQYQVQNAKSEKPNAYLMQRQQESHRYQSFQRNQGVYQEEPEQQMHRRASSHDDFLEEIKSDEENIAQWSKQKLHYNYEDEKKVTDQSGLHMSGSIELKLPKNQTDQSEISNNQELLVALSEQLQMCNLRIQELVPNHPLPVVQEHLGQPNPHTDSLFKQIARYQEQIGYMNRGHKMELEQQQKVIETLQEENERLRSTKPKPPVPVKKTENNELQIQNLTYQNNQLKQENQRLQQVLRDETSLNEEQRNKIAILKESLERGIDPKLLKKVPTPNQSRQMSSQISMANIAPSPNKCDSPKSMIENYISLKQLSNENEALKKQLNEKIDNPQLKTKIDQLSKNLELKNEDINFYKVELAKLQQEIIQSQEEKRHLQSQITTLGAKNSQSETMNQELQKMTEINIQLKNQVQDLSNKLRDYQSIGESMKIEINESQLRVSQFKEKVKGENTDKAQLHKQLDELEIKCSQLEQEKNRVADEKSIIEKRAKIEIDSLKTIIAQNKDFIHQQETRVLSLTTQHQSDLADQRSKSESQNLEHLKQISSLTSKISDLEQKCYTLQYERTQLDEAFAEKTSNQQNFELESIKNKQMSEKIKQQQTQIINNQTRINTLEAKVQGQNQTVENMKQQNEWLKEERQKIQKEVQIYKSEIEKERKENSQITEQMAVYQSQNKELKEQVQTETERIQLDSDKMMTKLRQSEIKVTSLTEENQSLQSNQATLDKRIIGMQSDIAALRRDKSLLESQLTDLSSENDQLYRNEERTKRLLSEISELTSKVSILQKEVDHSDARRKDAQAQMLSLESELRLAIRQRDEIEEKYNNLRVQKESSIENIERYNQEKTKMVKEIEQIKGELSKTQLDKKILTQRMEDLTIKLNNTEKLKEDMQGQISRNIQKSNDYCLKFEQENKILEGIKLIQNNSNKALISPFLSQLIQQVEASDILKESLYHNIDDAVDYFLRISDPFLHIDTESPMRDPMQTERLIQFEYVKFLQQDIIEKLTQSLIESKSENIIIQTKNKSLNARLLAVETKENQSQQVSENQNIEMQRYEILLQEMRQEEKRMKIQNAGLRQKVVNLEAQNSELFALNLEKETQILSINHDTASNQKNQTMVHQKSEELNILQTQLQNEQNEKKYLWKALKSLKTFLKSDECFEPLLVMLNEYVILLEQLMFDQKKPDFKWIQVKSNEAKEKLKVVEQDMKGFRLPISVQNCLPQKQVFSETQATGYASARAKNLGKTVDHFMSNTTMFDTNQNQMQLTQNNIKNNYFSAKSTTILGKQLDNLIE